MQKVKRYYLWIGIVIFIIGTGAILWWLSPSALDASEKKTITMHTQNQTQTNMPVAISGSAFQSPSQADTQMNCAIRLSHTNNLIVDEQTRNCFEYFISQYGEKEMPQIEQDFQAYVQQQYTDPARSQLDDLWTRYLKYRAQLSDLTPPHLKQDDPTYYAEIFNKIKSLRTRFFSQLEIVGLFGNEDIYHEYTLNRLAILADKTLTEADKAKRLKALFEQLPEGWQVNLKQTSQIEELRTLTQSIKDRNGSADEIREMRMNLVGGEATQRLETLDQTRNEWKNQVTQYLTARQVILASNLSDSQKQQQIQKLRQQNFAQPQTQLRIKTYESIFDQGGTLPFTN